ncbi:hypothetical protein [Haloarchaeobius sp. DFWS5]|uniref:hypothetical protein n=1 Tax=Haloarchaeobius sp. DFWS5 TaxID=3446114 RepID=UPI003EC11A43
MSNSDTSTAQSDVVTLGTIADVMTDRSLLRPFFAVLLTVTAVGLALGLLPVLLGGFGADTLYQTADSETTQVNVQQVTQNQIARLVITLVPYFVPMVAALVAFVAGHHGEESRTRTVLPVAAGAFVGSLLCFVVAVVVAHSQYVPGEETMLFRDGVPPLDMANVFVNAILVSLTGAIGALLSGLSGTFLR